jgi:hypothetical protein
MRDDFLHRRAFGGNETAIPNALESGRAICHSGASSIQIFVALGATRKLADPQAEVWSLRHVSALASFGDAAHQVVCDDL